MSSAKTAIHPPGALELLAELAALRPEGAGPDRSGSGATMHGGGGWRTRGELLYGAALIAFALGGRMTGADAASGDPAADVSELADDPWEEADAEDPGIEEGDDEDEPDPAALRSVARRIDRRCQDLHCWKHAGAAGPAAPVLLRPQRLVHLGRRPLARPVGPDAGEARAGSVLGSGNGGGTAGGRGHRSGISTARGRRPRRPTPNTMRNGPPSRNSDRPSPSAAPSPRSTLTGSTTNWWRSTRERCPTGSAS